MSEKNLMREFNVFRHGEKTKEGQLSEKGIDHAREWADELFREMQDYEDGTVMVFAPSNIERAQQTRDVIEGRLIEHFSENKDNYKVIDVSNKQALSSIDEKTKEKVLIRGLGPDQLY